MTHSKEQAFRLTRLYEVSTALSLKNLFTFDDIVRYLDAELGLDRSQNSIQSQFPEVKITDDETAWRFVDTYMKAPEDQQNALLGFFLLSNYGINPMEPQAA